MFAANVFQSLLLAFGHEGSETFGIGLSSYYEEGTRVIHVHKVSA